MTVLMCQCLNMCMYVMFWCVFVCTYACMRVCVCGVCNRQVTQQTPPLTFSQLDLVNLLRCAHVNENMAYSIICCELYLHVYTYTYIHKVCSCICIYIDMNMHITICIYSYINICVYM